MQVEHKPLEEHARHTEAYASDPPRLPGRGDLVIPDDEVNKQGSHSNEFHDVQGRLDFIQGIHPSPRFPQQMGGDERAVVSQKHEEDRGKEVVGLHGVKLHVSLFKSQRNPLDFLVECAHLSDMKMSHRSFLAWLLGAALFTATMVSCVTETQTCSAYQEVQPTTNPAR